MNKILPKNINLWDNKLNKWRKCSFLMSDYEFNEAYNFFKRHVEFEFEHSNINFNIPSIHNINRLGVEFITIGWENKFLHGQSDERTVYFSATFNFDDVPKHKMHYTEFKLSNFAAIKVISPLRNTAKTTDNDIDDSYIVVQGFTHEEFDEILRQKCIIKTKNYPVLKLNEIPIKRRNLLPKIRQQFKRMRFNKLEVELITDVSDGEFKLFGE